MVKKTLLNKLEQTTLGISLALGIYSSPILANDISIEYKKTIGTVDINGDNTPEEFYVASTHKPLNEKEIHRIVWTRKLVMEENLGLGEPNLKTILTTLPDEPKRTSLCDYNKDKITDILYVIKNQEKNAPYEKRFEMYVLSGREGGFFSAPEFVKYVNE